MVPRLCRSGDRRILLHFSFFYFFQGEILVYILKGWLIHGRSLHCEFSFFSCYLRNPPHGYHEFNILYPLLPMSYLWGHVGRMWGRDAEAAVGPAFRHIFKNECWLPCAFALALQPVFSWSPTMTQFCALALVKSAAWLLTPELAHGSREPSVAERLLHNRSEVLGHQEAELLCFPKGIKVWDEEPKAKSGEETLSKER